MIIESVWSGVKGAWGDVIVKIFAGLFKEKGVISYML
jgi:hypothetical protein